MLEHAAHLPDVEIAAALFTLAPDARVLGVNAAAADLLGVAPARLTGSHLRDWLVPSAAPVLVALTDCLRQGRALTRTVVQVQHANGEVVSVALEFTPSFGQPAVAGIALLVAPQEVSLRELRRYAAIVNACADAIVSFDEAGLITSWNEGASALYGFDAEEVLGRSIAMLYAPERANEAGQLLVHVRNGGLLRDFDTRRRHRDGHEIDVSLSLFRLQSAAGFAEFAHDTGAIRRRMGVLLSWALEDPLTRLANRRALLDRLGVVLRKSERTGLPGALLFIDLDDFKQVNDLAGHEAGDAVLLEVAKRLRQQIREADTLARIGGDEFVVLLDQLEPDLCAAQSHAEAVAGKLIEALRRIEAGSSVCSASVGVTLFIGHALTGEKLLARADSAMYQAKTAGKNRVCSMPPPLAERELPALAS